MLLATARPEDGPQYPARVLFEGQVARVTDAATIADRGKVEAGELLESVMDFAVYVQSSATASHSCLSDAVAGHRLCAADTAHRGKNRGDDSIRPDNSYARGEEKSITDSNFTVAHP